MQALSERGAFSPHLAVQVSPGSILAALEARGLQAGCEYEAIICLLDSLAMQVIGELQGRGVRVPEEVALIGMHDGQEARVVTPSLTTVRLPWEQAGARDGDAARSDGGAAGAPKHAAGRAARGATIMRVSGRPHPAGSASRSGCAGRHD